MRRATPSLLAVAIALAAPAQPASETIAGHGRTASYWLLNGKAGYRFGIAHVFAYVDNLLDDDTPLLITPGQTTAEDVANLPQPRSYGIGLELQF